MRRINQIKKQLANEETDAPTNLDLENSLRELRLDLNYVLVRLGSSH